MWKLLSISALLFITSALSCKNADYVQLSNGKCYKFIKNYQSWTSAIQTCQNANGQLATLHSLADNSAIAAYLASNQWEETWIGLKCLTSANCVWEDGSPFDYRNFANNPPDVSNGNNCFYIKAGISSTGVNNAWFSQSCDRFTDYVLCEESTAPAATCGNYAELNGQCYQVKMAGANQADAETICCGEGGHLASIHDANSNQYLFDLQRQAGVSVTGWIGLTLRNTVHAWTDGSVYNYENFANAGVSDPSCFAMSVVNMLFPQHWISEPCTTQMPFVCQRPKSPNPVVVTTSAPLTTTTRSQSTCGQQKYTGFGGTINSPGYPSSFHGAVCNYFINGSSNAVNIQIPAIAASKYWALDIFAGSEPRFEDKIYAITSMDAPRALSYSSPTPYMLVTVFSSDDNNGQAFQMQWTSTATPQYSTGDLSYSTLFPPSSPQTSGQCDSRWIYDDNRDICIGFTQGLSFDVANTLCQQYSAQLLSIHSYGDENNILDLLDQIYYPGGYKLWIGGFYTSGSWTWKDGTVFQYSDFIDANTSPANGNCLAIENDTPSSTSKGWRASDCTLNLQAVCYKRPNPK